MELSLLNNLERGSLPGPQLCHKPESEQLLLSSLHNISHDHRPLSPPPTQALTGPQRLWVHPCVPAGTCECKVVRWFPYAFAHFGSKRVNIKDGKDHITYKIIFCTCCRKKNVRVDTNDLHHYCGHYVNHDCLKGQTVFPVGWDNGILLLGQVKTFFSRNYYSVWGLHCEKWPNRVMIPFSSTHQLQPCLVKTWCWHLCPSDAYLIVMLDY